MTDPDDAMALLRALVEAESANPPGRTTGPAGVARDWLAARGLEAEVVAADPEKPNLVLHLANGPGPHLVFNAHLDTIPMGDPVAWSAPPLELTERDGRLIGLGTGNMKGAAAAMCLAVDRLNRARHRWSGRVTLTLVADECVFGPAGAAHLLDTRDDVLGDLLICGEGPGSMALAVAEKGLLWLRLVATAPPAQGMLTRAGASAPARLAAALTRLDAWNAERIAAPLASLDHQGNAEGLRPSVNVGRLGGGGFISQGATEAWAEIDLRLPPGLTLEQAGAKLDALCAEGPGLRWERIKGWDPNWTDPAAPVADAVRQAAAEVRGAPPPDVTRLPASDASRWRSRGVPAVCFGPQPELASGVDDYVDRQDFLDCIEIYERAAHRLLPPQTAE